MKLPDIDGEWELITETVSDIAYGESTRRYKRIQPKEKSLYEKAIPIEAQRPDDYFNKAQLNALNIICQHIEALEKRVEELDFRHKALADAVGNNSHDMAGDYSTFLKRWRTK